MLKFSAPRRNGPARAVLIALVSLGAGLAIGLSVSERGSDTPTQQQGGQRAGQGGNQSGGGARQRPPAVALVPVKTATVDSSITAVGTSRAVKNLVLTADVSGLVEKIEVRPGEQVEAGEALIVLQKDEQEIALARARADYDIARTNAARFTGLVADEAASALESENAQNALTAATAARRQAEFELRRRTIRAPFGGVVGITMLNVGDFLTSGATIASIDDISSVIVDFVVPEGTAPLLTVGQEIEATARAVGGRAFPARIRAIDSRIDPATRTLRVEALVDNADGALVPGATFSVAVASGGRPAFEVPGLAVQWDRAGSYVWRVGAEGGAERISVLILKRTAQSVLVDGALTEGDMVVAEGADLVRAGVPLAPAAASQVSRPVGVRSPAAFQ